MKILRFSLLLSAMLTASSHAQVIFEQDFQSSTSLSTYISGTAAPTDGQWNSIDSSGAGVTVTATNNNLSYTRTTANSASFTRNTDFDPIPTAIMYQFTLSVSGNTAQQTSAASWAVGNDFTTTNSSPTNSLIYARMGLNFTTTDGTFQIRDLTSATNSVDLSGIQAITWVLNNTGALLSYTSPLGTSSTVANDRTDIWAGTTLLFNDVAVQTAANSIADLKFVFNNGSGTIVMDNFLITAIPEPTTYALIGFGVAFTLWRMRRRGFRG